MPGAAPAVAKNEASAVAKNEAPAVAKNEGFYGKNKKTIGVLVCLIVGLLIWFGPSIAGLKPESQHILATIIVLILGLIFEIMSIGLLSMLWVVSLIVTKLEEPSVALAGFQEDVTFLVLGAFMIGQSAVKTGAAKRIAYTLMSFAGNSYKRITLMLYGVGWILGMAIPSGTARMAIVFPIFIGLLVAFKAKADSPESLDLMLQVKWAFSTGGPSIAWLTGSLVNPIIMGNLTKITGQSVSWGQWALWMIVPTISIAFLMWYSTSLFTGAKPVMEGGAVKIKEELNSLGKMGVEEKKSLLWMGIAVALWATGDLTGIEPAWTAMLVGLLLFAPQIGVLKNKDLKELDWGMVLFAAAALSMAAVISEAKIDVWAVQVALNPIIGPLSHLGRFGSYAGIWVFGYAIHFLIPSGTATAAAVAPLTIKFAVANHLNPVLAAFTTNFANRPFIFPYQIMSIMLLWGFAKPSIGRAAKVLGLQSIIWFGWSLLMIAYLDLVWIR